jgi:hypothetical protein
MKDDRIGFGSVHEAISENPSRLKSIPKLV